LWRVDLVDSVGTELRGRTMNRRDALLMTGAALALTIAPRAAKALPADNPQIAPAARDLYERALVFDANAAPRFEDSFPYSKASLDIARTSGVTAVKTSIGGTDANFDATVADIAFIQRTIEAHPETFMQIRSVGDFTLAKQSRRLGILFSFESVEMLAGDPDRITLFRNLGVRVMQLSYNKTSVFGSGVLADPKLGLTDLGRKAVEAMNKAGVALDLSHANPATSLDALKVTTRPALITHAGCAAIHAHPRNKDDKILRAVADKGGVVGIYDLPYLTASPKQPTLDDYMAHMKHALDVCGEDHVGIGSDSSLDAWDTSPEAEKSFQESLAYRKKTGVAAPEEDRPLYVIGLNTNRRTEVIADALLKRGYSARVAEKVLGANFIAAFGRIWT
jgi:membrane dipeptidase